MIYSQIFNNSIDFPGVPFTLAFRSRKNEKSKHIVFETYEILLYAPLFLTDAGHQQTTLRFSRSRRFGIVSFFVALHRCRFFEVRVFGQ